MEGAAAGRAAQRDARALTRVFWYLSTVDLLPAAAACSEWRPLSRRALKTLRFREGASSDALVSMCRSFKALVAVDFSAAAAATRDRHIAALAKRCSKLARVELAACASLTDDAVESLATGCSGLTYVDLSECALITDVSICHLADSCRDLADLSLGGCTNISDSSVWELASSHPELHSLNVAFCQVDDSGVCALAECCHKLAMIDLCGCAGITDASAKALAAGCPATLTEIDLSWCSITDAAGAYCLRSHDRTRARVRDSRAAYTVSCCSADSLPTYPILAAAAVLALVGGCPNLARLSIDFCDDVTDGAVAALAWHGHALVALNLQCVPPASLSADTFRTLTAKCAQLVHTNIGAFFPARPGSTPAPFVASPPLPRAGRARRATVHHPDDEVDDDDDDDAAEESPRRGRGRRRRSTLFFDAQGRPFFHAAAPALGTLRLGGLAQHVEGDEEGGDGAGGYPSGGASTSRADRGAAGDAGSASESDTGDATSSSTSDEYVSE